jgi:hypothetical protein
MLQDRASSEENCRRFIERVKDSQQVWGLRSPSGGWAQCPSHEFEGKSVIVFWSDRAYAARHAKDDWFDYEPTLIDFDRFIDDWLYGMHQDGILAGPNWDSQLSGLEIPARELASQLTTNSA